MEFLSTIEELAMERGQQRGQQIGAKENCRQNILDLLEKRFNSLPETLIKAINEINDLALLKRLLLETITVNSVAEFEELIKDDSFREN
ncbi:hypothetical protein [Okeania sp. KiyG1]|uniref:hypothetical protein n=1 Tax=Okeania sp. KiyG1 TaxID=2720165 RepID=UPI00192469D5|nr:hypothetical protein [Okeania sp. KiyG1]GGA12186.1 hypothetical protein CYANOKiyG1_25350 [Okeania sp. KiyG1]